ncbi:MAG: hypothetical protein WCI77_00720 [Candidatus Omnitrophota bacterium]
MSISKYIFLSIIISFSLVLLGDSLVLQRTVNPPIAQFSHGQSVYFMKIGGDADYYLRMAQGEFSTVPAPFRYRIFLPFIAHFLPFASHTSFKLISYASLFILYILLLLLCRDMHIAPLPAFFTLFAFFVAPWQLYIYHNPFYFDAFGLLLITLMIWAYLHRFFLLFLFASIIGIFSRENTIFIAPWWVMARERKRGILVLVIILLAYILSRIFLSSSLTQPFAQVVDEFSKINIISQFSHIPRWGALANVWGGYWLLAMAGIGLLPNKLFISLSVGFLLMFCGTIVSFFFAAAYQRMVLFLLPFLFCFCAPLFSILLRRRLFVIFIFVPLLIAKLFCGMATVFTAWDSWVFSSFLPRGILLTIDLLISIYIIYMFRFEIFAGLKEKKNYSLGHLWRGSEYIKKRIIYGNERRLKL